MAVKSQNVDEITVTTNGGSQSEANGLGTSEILAKTATRSLIKVTSEDVKAHVEAQLQTVYERALEDTQQEIAEPYGEWDLVALGPIQPGAGRFPGRPPFLPHQIIRVGEYAFVVTILYVPKLYHFCLPYEVEYCTGEVCDWRKGPAYLNVKQKGFLSPKTPFAVDVLRFKAEDAGKFEMNICARIQCCDPHTNAKDQPPYAGFARRIYDLDPGRPFPFFGLRFEPPQWQFDHPIRFLVYE